ncbi:nitroreductase [Paenibacillus dendritiformis]|uniref:nitroreductase n=1 Tax=Paenibacillus dendritiformis TaxID=130049 RepID=UPI00365A6E3D
MLDFPRILIEGALLSAVFLAVLLLSLAYNPRIWLQDYPQDIQRAAPPRTPTEKKQFTAVGTIVMLLIFVPFVSSIYAYGNDVTFWGAFLHLYLVFNMVSLADLIILDWLIFCAITPSFIVIPGTRGAAGYKDYRFHLIGFLKGAVMSAAVCLLLAGLRVAMTYI